MLPLKFCGQGLSIEQFIYRMGGCMASNRDESRVREYCKSRFKWIQPIGKGAFGQVWKVIDKNTGEVLALKIMDKLKIIAKKSIKTVIQQKNILETLALERSDLISNIRASFQDRQKAYILMEFISGRNLRGYLTENRKLNEEQIKFIIVTLLKIIRYIHSKKIIHRDIKPENIMIDQRGFPHITDFGIASLFHHNNARENGGTLPYMAPEVVLGLNHTYSIDYYAIGIITFELFFLKRPHTSATYEELSQEIIAKDIDLSTCPELQAIPSVAADFIIQLTKRKPEERLGFKSINEIFEHPWISSENIDSLIVSNHCQIFECDQQPPRGQRQGEIETNDSLKSIMKRMLDRDHIKKMFEPFDSFHCRETLSAPTETETKRSYSLTAQDLKEFKRQAKK